MTYEKKKKCKYCGAYNQGEMCYSCKQKLALIRKMKIILRLLKMGLNPLDHKELYDDVTE